MAHQSESDAPKYAVIAIEQARAMRERLNEIKDAMREAVADKDLPRLSQLITELEAIS